MQLTDEQKLRIAIVLEQNTYPKEQFGFFSMDDLIKLIEKAIG